MQSAGKQTFCRNAAKDRLNSQPFAVIRGRAIILRNQCGALYMSEVISYKAACFCGSVELELSGAPVFQGYCHCDSCKQWLGAPVNAATLWPTEAVQFTKGEKLLGNFAKTPRSQRKHCTKCGSNVLNAHYDEGLIDVFAPNIRGFKFEPAMHVHYQERLMNVPDNLPKFADLPSDFGGSGRTVD